MALGPSEGQEIPPFLSKEQMEKLGVPTIWEHDPKKITYLCVGESAQKPMHYHQSAY